ncbi:NAD(P)/FAD-dependent oxidoreductase [Bradyrhizobium sp. WSM1253]|uniref:FAD-dependent oxidoreductase n=1 Tax=Bradyrhizobium sp. WSM1253 TaxID=319003 RepID=UPI00025D29E1|nr:FAD-dependent monooxygenase [Bradyrhizobium sp. WSM1253]EIG61371.1 2-polyprenyl-6-methoxyphenol hydroxylase-like oxidoreductase [Bradyrhizobium sp. WSM1253]
MADAKRVLIAGAGPVGMVAAATLVKQGIPVTVLEAASDLSTESRASTFHPPTLDMLEDIGVAKNLIAEGLVAPTVQYRNSEGPIANFDFGDISDLTGHPYRLQCEQYKLTRIIAKTYGADPNLRIEFDAEILEARQGEDGISVKVRRPDGSIEQREGLWLIGADGARSAVRKSIGVTFDGFTWPERFLVVSTHFDFLKIFPDLASVSYVADPVQWYFLLKVPGMWRAMFPISPEVPDEKAGTLQYGADTLAGHFAVAATAPIDHVTLYRVHQRVAATFRSGRVFLAGDAAHINNPLGGMGMNGGIHDVVNLCGRLTKVWRREADPSELDRYDRQRRLVTLEYVQKHTIENKRNLESRDPREQQSFRTEMARTAANPELARNYLMKISMLASLKRAAELG